MGSSAFLSLKVSLSLIRLGEERERESCAFVFLNRLRLF